MDSIKPTMGGLENMAAIKDLERALKAEYPDDDDAITAGNALGVLRRVWV